ncbi:hypothetical protein KJK34_07015 [Flavobacterium sp. D11R37]|uniref:hypothetical protein n=1 Tax=Flavobacterium coralii TaxID=2838017 RepID=UPI001CA6765D|nr:hypothetical protein [Flavobacterium coralii]MBY8962499.1 hypothetical protein [Flavobacterium coralii]
MSSRTRKRKIFVLIFAGLYLLKIITAWASYLQNSYNLNNPLIPTSLLDGIRDYTIFITGISVIAIVLALLYIITKRFFWLIAALLIVTFIVLALKGNDIRYYYTRI